MKQRRVITTIICIIFLIWITMLGTDYRQTTHHFEKPIFARCCNGADDGGSGTYKGLGYAVEIQGNFMPEDEFPGVTQARFYILGKLVKESLRD